MITWWHRWKYLFSCIGIIVAIFIGISILDVLIAVMNLRFYSNAVFVTTFGVGGVFAGMIAYMQGISLAPAKNEMARWSTITLIIGCGVLFWFLLSEWEGGEYRLPFKAFGLMTALTTLLFMKGKIE